MDVGNSLYIEIGGLVLHCKTNSEDLSFSNNSTALPFQVLPDNKQVDYNLVYQCTQYPYDLSNYKEVFVGNIKVEDIVSYGWSIHRQDEQVVIKVSYKSHSTIQEIVAVVSDQNKLVQVYVYPKSKDLIEVDPYIHPLGALLSLYLLHWNEGTMIHASGVIDGSSAYAFTGVSGIGKTTMSKLWREKGHQVINDDRLVLRLVDEGVKVYNSPMPYYYQDPHESVLKKIFILKQHPTNYIKKLSGVEAFTKVLGNFIQQFYQPEMVKAHLGILEAFLTKVEVFELGFKPDTEVVDLIKNK